MEFDLLRALLLLGVGTAAGILNILAGGGSLLTLPVLIFLGLPPAVANGTNRIALLCQNIVAVGSFHRDGKLPWKLVLLCAPSAVLGSLLGARLAVTISDAAFKQILAGVMVLVVVLMIIDPARRLQLVPRDLTRGRAVVMICSFFAVGVYGGFVQAGVGFLIISALLVHGLDLVRINAVKVAVVLAYMISSLAVFALNDKVNLVLGLALAVGTSLGGWLGARLAVKQGHGFIRKVVMVAVVAMAVRLFFLD
jgi:uncharacterized membrane protein YfcA